jgi:hypothetical protein
MPVYRKASQTRGSCGDNRKPNLSAGSFTSRSPFFASGLLPSGYLVVLSWKISLLGFPDKICGLRNHHRFVIL